MQPDAAALLWDALEAARSIVSFLDGVSVDDYADDLLRRRAVEREFEIVGEALGRLRRADSARAARVPGLKDAVGLRNILIHGYAEIDDARVYDTAAHDLPGLVDTLAALMAEISDEHDPRDG